MTGASPKIGLPILAVIGAIIANPLGEPALEGGHKKIPAEKMAREVFSESKPREGESTRGPWKYVC